LSRCLPGIGSTAAGLFFLISQCYAASEKRLVQPSLQLVGVVQDLCAIMWI
jgi:muramidase (phage lysozyme)